MIQLLHRHRSVMPAAAPRARHAATALLACIGLALLLQHAHAQPALVDIGTLGGDAAYPNGMNAIGQVVGGSYVAGNTEQHAFLWTPDSANGTTGAWTDLGK